MLLGVEEREVVPVDGEADSRALSGCQADLLEALELLDGAGQGGLAVAYIHLYGFLALAIAGVGHGDAYCHAAVGVHLLLVDGRLAIFEAGVAETVSEGEQRLGLLLGVSPSVAHVDAVLVLDVHGVSRGDSGVFSKDVGGNVLKLLGEGEGQLARGVHVS